MAASILPCVRSLPCTVARSLLPNYRNCIRFFLIAVIIYAFFLNLGAIVRKKDEILEKMFYNSLRNTPEKIRSPVFARNQPHQRMNPQSNALQNTKHSKESLLSKMSNSSLWTRLVKSLQNSKSSPEKHLLVIVTTWVASEEKRLVHENVVRLWSHWPESVQPIVYLLPADNNKIDNKKSLMEDFHILIKNGWIVRPIPKVNCGDVPVLKSMILDAMQLFPNSHFYGFANSDILFDSGLIETIKATKRLVPTQFPVLVIGQRTNLNVTRGVRFSTRDSVLQASKKGALMKGIAIDYFITNHLFPWEKMPDIVIGRIYYDNWMTYFGISHDAIVIEATDTITALHQTTADGNAAGWQHPHRDCNKLIIRKIVKGFQTRWGYTWCAPHKALRNPRTGSIELKTREVSKSCNPRTPPFVFSKVTDFAKSTTKPKKQKVGKT